MPTSTPSTFTCILLGLMAVPIPVTLSMAQPLTKIVPETVAPATGVSMLTLGSQFETVTLTLAEPVSGVASVSVAQTVMVCGPLVRMSVSRLKL